MMPEHCSSRMTVRSENIIIKGSNQNRMSLLLSDPQQAMRNADHRDSVELPLTRISGEYTGSPTSAYHEPRKNPLPWQQKLLNLVIAFRSSSTYTDNVIYAISFAMFVLMSIHFYIPSSLYMYLVGVCFTVPALLGASLWKKYTGAINKTSTVRWVVCGTITAFVIFCVACDTLFQDSTPSHWREPRKAPYYIASLLRNSEVILPKYKSSMLKLIQDLGASNVFVSIYENDSTDKTPALLRDLATDLTKLGVRHRIMEDLQSDQVRGWERIDRLSLFRNLAMEPLNGQLAGQLDGRPFDKVIWINDVLFEADTVQALLDTEKGDFDQACVMDFCWLGFYDTWVMRDADGNTTRPFWPYFKAEEDQRRVHRGQPVPVDACWNGITAFDARWYLNSTVPSTFSNTSLHSAASTLPTPPYSINDEVDDAATLPLSFRGSKRCFSSESLLSSLDMHRIAHPKRPRIYVNPNLAVTYDYPNYALYHGIMKWTVVKPWLYLWQYWIEHRIFGFLLHPLGRVDPCTELHRRGWVPRAPLPHRS